MIREGVGAQRESGNGEMPIRPYDALWRLILDIRFLPVMQCHHFLKIDTQIGLDGVQRSDLIFEDFPASFLPD